MLRHKRNTLLRPRFPCLATNTTTNTSLARICIHRSHILICNTCTISLSTHYSCDHGYGPHRIPSNAGTFSRCSGATQRSRPLRETYRETVACDTDECVGDSAARPGSRRVERSRATGGDTEYRDRQLVTGTDARGHWDAPSRNSYLHDWHCRSAENWRNCTQMAFANLLGATLRARTWGMLLLALQDMVDGN